MLTKWNDHKYRCEECGQDITSREHFISHMSRYHAGLGAKSLYLCPQCQYATADYNQRAKHIRAHLLPNAVSCSNCPFIGVGGHLKYHRKLCKYSSGSSQLTDVECSKTLEDIWKDDDVASKSRNMEMEGKTHSGLAVMAQYSSSGFLL